MLWSNVLLLKVLLTNEKFNIVTASKGTALEPSKERESRADIAGVRARI